jgi:hypothetical protein
MKKLLSISIGTIYTLLFLCMSTMSFANMLIDNENDCMKSHMTETPSTEPSNTMCDAHNDTDATIQSNNTLIEHLNLIQNPSIAINPFEIPNISMGDKAHYKQRYPGRHKQISLYLNYRNSVMLRI